MKAIVGKKIGMTQIFQEDGKRVPVTIVDVEGAVVSSHLFDGEEVSHIEIGIDQVKHPNKPDTNNYKQLGFVPRFKINFKAAGELKEVGTKLGADIFEIGDKVHVTGTTRGMGFQGGVKRWGFKGGPKTHGQSDKYRSPGSIGSGTTPGRVLKGKKMAGNMGNVKQTTQNLRVIDVNTETNTIAIKGAIPGHNGGYVIIQTAKY